MSEIRLVIREADRDWSGDIHASCADAAVAALSADPVTLDELERAVARFQARRDDSRYFSNLRPGLRDEPCDAGLLVIDLAARLVVVDSIYSSPGPKGGVHWHDGRSGTDIVLPYHLAGDWQFLHDSTAWKGLANRRREERMANPPRDVRSVFYGRPLLEFLARGVFAAFPRREEIAAAARAQTTQSTREWLARKAGISPEDVDPELLAEEASTRLTYRSPYYDTLKDIHAAWLLTPREDLGGLCPREAALNREEHLGRDMDDRCQSWSRLDHPPPALDQSSFAYRFGGFGTHELVMYYDLVRAALGSCWNSLEHQHETDPARAATLTIGDFLAIEIPRLESECEAWLDTPDDEFHGRTPRSIIERERRRLPEGMSGREAMHDPDCPCCQMMADMPGVSFWHLDGSAMDYEFAFDIYHRTREEWDDEQREHEEFSRRFNAKWAERQRLGLPEDERIWSSSFAVGDTADVPLGIRIFGIGSHLAELIADLRQTTGDPEIAPQNQHWIDQLNRDFGNLREILQSAERSLAATLFDPVTGRFAETLAGVAAAHPELSAKCDALTNQTQRLLAPPMEPPDWNPGEDDVPF